jgi:tRNA(Ile)-lysidine synthase
VLEQLLNHINRHALCKTTDKILLAVSGGIDSMVMLHAMHHAGFGVAVAHCNFQLRGEASTADETLVRDTCQQYNVPFLVKQFDTAKYASANGISIQMAARDLRYAWFLELTDSGQFDYLATGHHYDDVIESVLLNLTRGTGIDGFRGIAAKKARIIRPLLFATRKMVEAYATDHHVTWREDISNASDDYQRNYVRHQIVPRLQELNPAFEEGFRDTQERMLGARELMLAFLKTFRSTATEVRDQRETLLDIRKIRQFEYPAVLLWELIKEAGFKYDQCRKIVADHQPGKIFHSPSHQLVVDRTHYIIEKKQVSGFVTQTIDEGQRWAGNVPFILAIREVMATDFQLSKDSSLAQLDAGKLQFPLVWRKWQAGDYFIPLGMQQEKKLSDFLIDLKIPFNSKADITVIQSGREIAWVVGFRISERFKVTENTKRVLVIEQKHERE